MRYNVSKYCVIVLKKTYLFTINRDHMCPKLTTDHVPNIRDDL